MKAFITFGTLGFLIVVSCNKTSKTEPVATVDSTSANSVNIPYTLHIETGKIELLESSSNATLPTGPGITSQNKEALGRANFQSPEKNTIAKGKTDLQLIEAPRQNGHTEKVYAPVMQNKGVL